MVNLAGMSALSINGSGKEGGSKVGGGGVKAKGGEGMKNALEVYKERFPHIKAIFIGTRRTDPHGCKSIRVSDFSFYSNFDCLLIANLWYSEVVFP